MINCGNGSFNLLGRVIHDHALHGVLSMADVLAHSSNIGAIQIGLKVGDQQLYKYVRKFGFGRKTGIELPGESPGILRKVENWTPTSIGSVAMGQEVGVTSLQLALAGAAVANGGMLVKPKLILARQKKGEALERFADEKPDRAIAPETAIQMRQMMEGVVLHGTGTQYATIKGYTSGGKTGSAQIYDLKAHVYTHNYNASFLGFAPVTNPQIVVAVTLHDTQERQRGIRRAGGGSGIQQGRDDGAADAGRAEGFAGQLLPSQRAGGRRQSTIYPLPIWVEPGCASVSSVTLPPVQADSSAAAEESRSQSKIQLGPAAFFDFDAGGAEGAGFPGDDAAGGAGGIGGDWRTNRGIGKWARAEAGAAGRDRSSRRARGCECSSPDDPRRSVGRSGAARSVGAGDLRVRTIAGLAYDSRKVEKDFLFFAFPGSRLDGRGFARDAMARGALRGGERIAASRGFRGHVD